MPTKHKRHAITETPPVKAALDELRKELNGERVDLGELVVIGAHSKLESLRSEDEERARKLRKLADDIRTGKLDVDPRLADEAKRASIPEEASDF